MLSMQLLLSKRNIKTLFGDTEQLPKIDQDGSVHFVNGDEIDNERRYVDALNSLNDSPDMRRLQYSESQVFGSLDDYHLNEQYLNQMSLEGSLHNHRNNEIDQALLSFEVYVASNNRLTSEYLFI